MSALNDVQRKEVKRVREKEREIHMLARSKLKCIENDTSSR